MSAVWFAVRLDCRSRWRAMLLLVVLVAAAGTAILTPALMARRTSSAFERSLERAHAADVVIDGSDRERPDQLDVAPAPSLEGLPGVLSEQRGVGIFMFFPDLPWLSVEHLLSAESPDPRAEPVAQGPSPAVFAFLDSSPPSERELLAITSGRQPRWDAPDELIVSSGLASVAGWTVGSHITVQILAGPIGELGPDAPDALERFKALLVERAMTVVGIGGPVDSARGNGQDTVVATPALVEATHANVQYTLSFVNLAKGTSAESVVTEAKAAGRCACSINQVRSDLVSAYSDSVRPDVVILVVFALVTALVAALVIGHALGREAQSASVDIATRRALGMTRAQLALGLMARTSVVVLMGVAGSVAISVALSSRLLGDAARAVDPTPGVLIEPLVLFGGAVIIVALVSLFSLPAVARVVAQRPGRSAKRSVVVARLAAVGAPIPVVIGARHAFESGNSRSAFPLRSAAGVGVVALAVAGGASLFAASLDRLVSNPARYGVTWDLVIGSNYDVQRDCVRDENDECGDVNALLNQRAADMERFLQSQQTVRGYTPIVNATAMIDGAEVTVVGLGDGEVRPVIVEGASPRDGEIALGAVELSEHHLSIGDLVTVAPDITLRVVGIALVPVSVDDSSAVLGRNALTSYDDAVRIGVFRHAAGFLVSMRSRSDIEPLIASFEQAFALPQDAFVGSAQADPITIVDYRRVRSVPLSMAVTLALLGMSTLALGLVGSLRRRGADFAVLRVFGATRRQTLGAAVAQVMLLVGGVLLVAIPVGLVASRSLWLAIERRLGTVSGVSWPVLPIVLSVAVGGVMLTLAMLRPWRHVSRSNIVALLNRS